MLARLSFVALVAVSLLAVPLAAQAQYFGDSSQTFSSTADEGVQRGYADVVRSYGMASLLNSQAVNQIEQARKQYIENQLRAVQVYVDAHRYNNEYRTSLRPTPLSFEQYVRLAREQAPEPLTATQLDPLTGMINWPAALRAQVYEGFRKRLERLFLDRATGYTVYGEIQAVCQEFAERLQADLQKFPAADYIAAKKFLDSLAWAGRAAQA